MPMKVGAVWVGSAILGFALEGRTLAGRYRLISQLGRGGMGSVWRAEHIDLGTPAAVKLIDETFAQSPEALTRFRREAQAAASLRSANVVQILDYGVDGETPFIAMELLEGQSLADRLERLGRLDPAYCASILIQVSKALARAHEAGIVHRDLKPDNIFLVRDGDDEIAKVLDFGIAKRTSALQTSSDMATRTGSLMGTPYYMSPEQASGRRQVDQRTDVWAFAVIAYECVTGSRPFDDSNLGGLLLSICTESPAPASQKVPISPAFDAWFARCTVKDPAGRFDTIRDAAAELCRAIGVAAPASRLFASSQPDGDASALVVQSTTSPWAGSKGVSAATPGAVIVTSPGLPTLAQSPASRVTPLLVTIGAIAALGIISVVGVVAWRSLGSAAPSAPALGASAAAVSAAPLVPPAPPPAVTPIAVAPVAPPPTVTAPVAPIAPSVESAAPKNPAAAAPVVVPRQGQRHAVPARPAEPSAPVRLRPQDRLERDLGF
jgi:eukaryotic-like serine/threonine-protein kinase